MKRLNIIALITFVVALGWVFNFDTETTRSVKQRVVSVFSPFIRTGATVQEKLQDLGQAPRDPAALAAENEELKRNVEELTLYNRDRDQIRAENDELRRMLDFSKNQGLKVIPSRILTRNSATWYNTATIDRGFKQGLSIDMQVVTSDGLVGKIAALYENEAEVLLLTDETCQVSVRIEGTPHMGILTGYRGVSGHNPDLHITYLPKDAQIEPGQKVYTAGKGRTFQAGFFIGEVKMFRQLDLEGEVVVKPAVDFDKIRYVFVIDNQPGEPTTTGTPPPLTPSPVPPTAPPAESIGQ